MKRLFVSAYAVIPSYGNGIHSRYVHVQQNSGNLKKGDIVKAGQQIANIGNSGITIGPHLHFVMTNKEGVTMPFKVANLIFQSKSAKSMESSSEFFATFNRNGRYTIQGNVNTQNNEDVQPTTINRLRDFTIGNWRESLGFLWTFLVDETAQRVETSMTMAMGRPSMSYDGTWTVDEKQENILVDMGLLKMTF